MDEKRTIALMVGMDLVTVKDSDGGESVTSIRFVWNNGNMYCREDVVWNLQNVV